ncbi:hypothetical protein BJX70DRAFT_394333 [Aspergillus crustosus]
MANPTTFPDYQTFDSRLVSTLQDLVLTNKITPEEAASDLASTIMALAITSARNDCLFEDSVGQCFEDLFEGGLNHFWALIFDIAAHHPAAHKTLATTVQIISQQPTFPTLPGDSEPCKIYGEMPWKYLPMLSWTIEKRWICRIPSTCTPRERKGLITEWVNVNRFVAQIVATDPKIGSPWYAVATLRDALETCWEYEARGSAGDEDEGSYTGNVPAAAAWIEILGVEIYKWDRDHPSAPSTISPGRGGPLWEGKQGFCKERWVLWRERFGEIARDENAPRDDRSAAAGAEIRMRAIEEADVTAA